MIKDASGKKYFKLETCFAAEYLFCPNPPPMPLLASCLPLLGRLLHSSWTVIRWRPSHLASSSSSIHSYHVRLQNRRQAAFRKQYFNSFFWLFFLVFWRQQVEHTLCVCVCVRLAVGKKEKAGHLRSTSVDWRIANRVASVASVAASQHAEIMWAQRSFVFNGSRELQQCSHNPLP